MTSSGHEIQGFGYTEKESQEISFSIPLMTLSSTSFMLMYSKVGGGQLESRWYFGRHTHSIQQ